MVRWMSVGIVASSLVGCGPSYGILLHGDLTPELWAEMGDAPAKLYGRIDAGESSVTTVLAAYCPGDERLDVGAAGEIAAVIGWGCKAELRAEVWLAPDDLVPRADGFDFADSEDALLACDDTQRRIATHDSSFTSEGWPNAWVSAFEGEDGSSGVFESCTGTVDREIVLD